MTIQRGHPALYIAVFFVSFATIIVELAMTRIFSVLLWYHFVFFVVSVSVLGLGLGGLIVNHLEKRGMIKSWERFIVTSLMAYGMSLPLTVGLLLAFPAPELWWFYLTIAIGPFILGGIFTATVFQHFSESSSKLYASDLMGAALGSMMVVLLLEYVTPIDLLIFLGGMALLMGTLYSVYCKKHRWVVAGLLLGATILGLGLMNKKTRTWDINLNARLSQGKTLFRVTKDRARVVDTLWDSFSRVDLTWENDTQNMLIFTDGGAASEMIRFDGDFNSVAYLMGDTGYPALTWGNPEKMLIIGAGGGKDVLMGLMSGIEEITAVEVNPKIARIVHKYSEYNGGIFERDEVRFVVGDGRNYIDQTKEYFDVISLPLVYTQAAENVGLSLAENYVFTKEAFRAYFKRLSAGGRIVLKLHSAIDTTRALMTALSVLQEQGLSVREGFNRFIIYDQKGYHGEGLHMPVLVIGKNEFQRSDMEETFRDLANKNFNPIFLPYVAENGSLGELAVSDERSIHEFLQNARVQLAPTTDAKPFFYNTEKGLPDSLTALLIAVFFITGIFGFEVYQVHKKDMDVRRRQRKKEIWSFSGYFAIIGISFMLIEIYLIQRFQLYLGHPTYSLSVVLFTLLLGGGIGSLITSYLPGSLLKKGIRWLGLTIGLLALVYGFGLNYIMKGTIQLPIVYRIAITVITMFPMGFLMGMPFPLGLKALNRERPEKAALMWALNGAFSVLGSVGAVVLAMWGGIHLTLFVGAIFYMGITFIIDLSKKIH